MSIYTASKAREQFFKITANAHTSHEPTYIVSKHGTTVLIAEEDYRAIMETLYITSIPNMRDSILKASKEPIETYSDDIDWDNV